MKIKLQTITPASEPQIIPLDKCLAKTRGSQNQMEPGCILFVHLQTTCQILREMKKIWYGYPAADLIFPETEWLAAFHDIGKCTPSFLSKIYNALGWPLPWGVTISEDEGGHARNSEIILLEKYGKDFARLAGGHHGGRTWNDPCLRDCDSESLGGKAWKELRTSLMEEIEQKLHLPLCNLRDLKDENAPLILGAAILADWLSSGMDLSADTLDCSSKALHQAIADAGLIPAPWQKDMTFETLFGFSPNTMQQKCMNNFYPGGVYIIESGMGSGKTEAALSIAYKLISEHKANGIYFAMPTRLTSEKIYDRLNEFLLKTVPGNTAKAMLIHGEAWLNWFLPQPSNDGFEQGKGNPPGSWFQTKKRALLAQFAAGTIDQALLSVINCRHRDLRAFALAGKVVILDEVHSYDCYTGTLIEELVHKLRQWGATVIILSATLTQNTRVRLLGKNGTSCDAGRYPYPAVSILPADCSEVQTIAIEPPDSRKVRIASTMNERVAMQLAVDHASEGEQVLWIENTVDKAQWIFRQICSAVSGIEVGLIHSRFPSVERNQREGYWVELLGKHGSEMRRKKGRILVATQVLEQSVDVDADYLVTRLAPCDMLLQRIGRLWRHPSLNPYRPEKTEPQILLLCPEQIKDPQNTHAFLPYDPYCVMRTAEVWNNLDSITLPGDIRPLLEKVYAERAEEGIMAYLKQETEKKRKELELKAHISCGEGNPLLSDETFGTRIDTEPAVQVLLIRKNNCGDSLKQIVHPFFDEAPIELPAAEASRMEKTRAAARLLKVMITVRESIAPKPDEFPVDFLSNVLWTGDNTDSPIRAAFVDESGLLLAKDGHLCGKYELTYHPEIGYCVNKEKREE